MLYEMSCRKVCMCVFLLPEQGCCGDVGGVSGTLQWFGSLLRP